MRTIFSKLVVMIVVATVSLWAPASENQNQNVVTGNTVDTQTVVSITPEVTEIPEEPEVTDVPDTTSIPEEPKITDEEIIDDPVTVEPEITEVPEDDADVPSDENSDHEKYESGWNDGYAVGFSDALVAENNYNEIANMDSNEQVVSSDKYKDGYADGYKYGFMSCNDYQYQNITTVTEGQ